MSNDSVDINNQEPDFDLPAEMFRTGEEAEKTHIVMQRLKDNIGPITVPAQFSEIDEMALFEGDIVLGPVDMVRGLDDPGAMGIGIKGAKYRWPGGVVPYVIYVDVNLPEAVQKQIKDSLSQRVKLAVEHWHKHTPIRLVPRTHQADYVAFEQQTGCWSRVGRQGGEQVISLGTGCGVGAAVHEIGHALGLWHEQSRSDRDDFIEIISENIKDKAKHNFDKHVQDGDDLGPYDYGSIMHYPANAFSKNDQPTIRVKGGAEIGQRTGLSNGDIAAIKLLYPDLDW